MQPQPHLTRAFLSALMAPGTVLEMRVLHAAFERGYVVAAQQYSRTLAGWYDGVNNLAVDAGRISGVSAYVTFNPCNPDLLARSDNRLTKAKHNTKDEDILCLRWLYLDIDPKRLAAVSSTDSEHAHALKLRDTLLTSEPQFSASALTGSSGNGAYILVRLEDLPNNKGSSDLIARALAALSARYSNDAASIDVQTKNPSRVMCLPGTIKCKGDHRPERPWRCVTLDNPEASGSLVPFDLPSWAAEHAPPQAAQKVVTNVPAIVNGHGDITHRAGRYLDSMAPAVAGNNGHCQTFDAACALVKGFDLSPAAARPILEAWNARCQPPWSAAELDHKLADADKMADSRPRGYLIDSPRHDAPARNGRHDGRPAIDAAPPVDKGLMPGAEDNPHRLARHYLSKCHEIPEGRTLRFWREEFYEWSRGCFRPVPKKEFQGRLATVLAEEFDRVWDIQLMRAGMSEDGPKQVKLIPVTTNGVNNVIQAINGMCQLESHRYGDPPFWVEQAGWPPTEVLPCRNTLVHLPSYVEGRACTMPPTPNFFSQHVLDYDWTPDAPPPRRWLAFLGSLWPHDPASIDLLQEWMGLQLVPDTRYQKIMSLIGPRRAGKGTIARVMKAMVGQKNWTGPSFGTLSDPFGLQSWIGKLCAVFDDAKLSPKTDQALIVEKLLSISGEGEISIPRKYLSNWEGRLTARMTILSNELPRFSDVSNALTGRFLVLKFKESFFNREDLRLESDLMGELPGILLWSIAGWDRLRRRGRFEQPASATGEIHSLEELSSPHSTFLDECCVIGEEYEVECPTLYLAWRQWCDVNGHREPGTRELFGRNLRTVLPNLHTTEARRTPAGRVRFFQGVRLLTPDELSGGDPAFAFTG
jgi:putative DNA primase/helicase